MRIKVRFIADGDAGWYSDGHCENPTLGPSKHLISCDRDKILERQMCIYPGDPSIAGRFGMRGNSVVSEGIRASFVDGITRPITILLPKA